MTDALVGSTASAVEAGELGNPVVAVLFHVDPPSVLLYGPLNVPAYTVLVAFGATATVVTSTLRPVLLLFQFVAPSVVLKKVPLPFKPLTTGKSSEEVMPVT